VSQAYARHAEQFFDALDWNRLEEKGLPKEIGENKDEIKKLAVHLSQKDSQTGYSSIPAVKMNDSLVQKKYLENLSGTLKETLEGPEGKWYISGKKPKYLLAALPVIPLLAANGTGSGPDPFVGLWFAGSLILFGLVCYCYANDSVLGGSGKTKISDARKALGKELPTVYDKISEAY